MRRLGRVYAFKVRDAQRLGYSVRWGRKMAPHATASEGRECATAWA